MKQDMIFVFFLFLYGCSLIASEKNLLTADFQAQEAKNQAILQGIAQALNNHHKWIITTGYSYDIGIGIIHLMTENKIVSRPLFSLKRLDTKNNEPTAFPRFYPISYDGENYISPQPQPFLLQDFLSITSLVERHIDPVKKNNTLLVFSLDPQDNMEHIKSWILDCLKLQQWNIIINLDKSFAGSDLEKQLIKSGYFSIEAQKKNYSLRNILLGSTVLIGLLLFWYYQFCEGMK